MYSGTFCVNVLVLRSLWFLPKSNPYSSPRHILLSPSTVTDGYGLVCANLNEWAQMLWRGGSVPCGLDAPLHSKQLQMIPEGLSCRWTPASQFGTKYPSRTAAFASVMIMAVKEELYSAGDFKTCSSRLRAVQQRGSYIRQ